MLSGLAFNNENSEKQYINKPPKSTIIEDIDKNN